MPRDRGSRRRGKKTYDSVMIGGMNEGSGKQVAYGFFNGNKLLDAIEEAMEKTGDGKNVQLSIVESGKVNDFVMLAEGAEGRDEDRGGGRRGKSSSRSRSSGSRRSSRDEDEDDDYDDEDDEDEDEEEEQVRGRRRRRPAADDEWEKDGVPF